MIKGIAVVLLIVVMIGGLSYCSYQYDRSKNYAMGYESRVMETVCKMHTPEHIEENLKEGICD